MLPHHEKPNHGGTWRSAPAAWNQRSMRLWQRNRFQNPVQQSCGKNWNAEYDEAKNEQAIMEAQIMEIQYTLDNSEIVDDDSISIDEVGLGSTIKVKNFRTGKIETLQIVSSNEANFKEGKISDESPIGKGALKKKVGDSFMIEAPAGELKFEILEISK